MATFTKYGSIFEASQFAVDVPDDIIGTSVGFYLCAGGYSPTNTRRWGVGYLYGETSLFVCVACGGNDMHLPVAGSYPAIYRKIFHLFSTGTKSWENGLSDCISFFA